jgi:hypothetical protein
MASDDIDKSDLHSSRASYDMSTSLKSSELDFLKEHFSIKFKAQKAHREHVILYGSSINKIRTEITEAHDWIWNYTKQRAGYFFKIYNYNDCMFDDVLFVGALQDIFINQAASNRGEQKELLMILEDSCRYSSYR